MRCCPLQRGFSPVTTHSSQGILLLPTVSLKSSPPFISALLFFLFLSPLLAFVEVPQAPFNYLPLPLGSRWETAFLCKYLCFMNMPSLSTLHRCGRSTDEMLIVARRGPLMHSSPCRNLAGAQTGNRRLGQGRLRQRGSVKEKV